MDGERKKEEINSIISLNYPDVNIRPVKMLDLNIIKKYSLKHIHDSNESNKKVIYFMGNTALISFVGGISYYFWNKK